MSTPGQAFTDKLSRRAASYRRWSKLNYGTAYTATVIAILASFFASLTALTTKLPSGWVAFLAGLPALMLILNNSFRYQERAFWHSKKAYRLESLSRQIEFKDLPVGDASDKLENIDMEMDEEWKRISTMRIPTTKDDN